MSTASPVTDSTFDTDVIGADGPVVVDFWAPWCGPCKRLRPILDELASQNTTLRVMTLDVDANPLTQRRFTVMSVPTVVLFVGGEPVKTVVGVKSVKALTKAFAGHL